MVMRDGPTAFRGDALADEIQLDGSRHLTIGANDKTGAWACTLHLIFEAEGGLREGEIEVEGPGAAFSRALEDVLDLEAHGLLRLRATFGDPDTEVVPLVVLVDQDEADSYRIIVDAD